MQWDLFDYVAVGVLISAAVLAFILLKKQLRTKRQRLIAGAGVLFVFLFIWAQLAVGIFGD